VLHEVEEIVKDKVHKSTHIFSKYEMGPLFYKCLTWTLILIFIFY